VSHRKAAKRTEPWYLVSPPPPQLRRITRYLVLTPPPSTPQNEDTPARKKPCLKISIAIMDRPPSADVDEDDVANTDSKSDTHSKLRPKKMQS
jgi:hypothetical protein